MRSYPAFSSLVGEKLSLHHGTHSPKVCGYLHAPRGVMEATELILDRTLPRPFPGRGGDMWFEEFSKCRSNDFSREARGAPWAGIFEAGLASSIDDDNAKKHGGR